MKVKLVYNSLIPKILRVEAITLYPFIFIRFSKDTTNLIVNRIYKHEMIHVRQIRRVGFFNFYFDYIYEFFINLFKYRNWSQAYLNITYEIEAYEWENESLTKAEKDELRRYTA